jgi:hypothetical protein
MENSPHYPSLIPAQVHKVRTQTFTASADLTPPRRRSGALGNLKSATQLMTEAALKRLKRPEIEN